MYSVSSLRMWLFHIRGNIKDYTHASPCKLLVSKKLNWFKIHNTRHINIKPAYHHTVYWSLSVSVDFESLNRKEVGTILK